MELSTGIMASELAGAAEAGEVCASGRLSGLPGCSRRGAA